MNTSNVRKILTPFYSTRAKEVLSSVIGQWSDGAYENSPRMEKYWQFSNVKTEPDGHVYIEIDAESYRHTTWNNKWLNNGFYKMSDKQVLEFFAGYVKRIMQLELRDEKVQHGWKRDNTEFETAYLAYDEKISVAHVYAIYDRLLDRPAAHKHDGKILAEIYGKPKSKSETACEIKKRAKIDAINAEWTLRRKQIEDAKKLMIAEAEKTYLADIDKLNKLMRAQLDAVNSKVS